MKVFVISSLLAHAEGKLSPHPDCVPKFIYTKQTENKTTKEIKIGESKTYEKGTAFECVEGLRLEDGTIAPPWCSTKIDSEGKHVIKGGHFKDCVKSQDNLRGQCNYRATDPDALKKPKCVCKEGIVETPCWCTNDPDGLPSRGGVDEGTVCMANETCKLAFLGGQRSLCNNPSSQKENTATKTICKEGKVKKPCFCTSNPGLENIGPDDDEGAECKEDQICEWPAIWPGSSICLNASSQKENAQEDSRCANRRSDQMAEACNSRKELEELCPIACAAARKAQEEKVATDTSNEEALERPRKGGEKIPTELPCSKSGAKRTKKLVTVDRCWCTGNPSGEYQSFGLTYDAGQICKKNQYCHTWSVLDSSVDEGSLCTLD